MISIISGKYKGKKLYPFKHPKVRPTQAKIRKSIFQILEPFSSLKILDLYAGVGTLGFESISRGASSVVLVEKSKDVYRILKKNMTLFEGENIQLYLSDSIKYLKRTKSKFDIIFADPPYQLIDIELLFSEAKKSLNPNGIFCLEMKKSDVKKYNFNSSNIRYYGNTQVVFWSTVE